MNPDRKSRLAKSLFERIATPYWGKKCPLCGGHISDSLLECLAQGKYNTSEGKTLRMEKPGVALACPYCNGLIGFDDQGNLVAAQNGWPVLRYSKTELHNKMVNDDKQPPQTPLPEWALSHRFMQPGTHNPLENYTFAGDAPANETVQ